MDRLGSGARLKHPGWTEDEEEMVKMKLKDGWSASQIANELTRLSRLSVGNYFPRTRNAVVSLVHRSKDMKLNPANSFNRKMGGRGGRPLPSPEEIAARREKKRSYMRDYHNRMRPRVSPSSGRISREPIRAAPSVSAKVEAPKSLTILELDPTTCRWPLTDNVKDMRYCGHKPFEDLPYCEGHSAIAFNRPNRS